MYPESLILSYKILIEELKKTKLDQETLETLKNELKDVIDSRRTSDNIEDVSDLIDVLDRRDELSPVNVDHLYAIVDKIGLRSQKSRLLDHVRLINGYSYRNPVKIPVNGFGPACATDHVLPDEVIEILASKLGKSWREFAVKLTIEPWNLETIDTMNIEREEKIKQILKLYVEENRGCSIRGQILNALSDLRRNDLKNQLEKMFMKPCQKC